MFSKKLVAAIIIIILLLLFSMNMNVQQSYLGRALIVLFIILITYCNIWLGLLSVVAAIYLFGFKESFTNIHQLFDQQNQLQKHVYYVPKRKDSPIPQNDTDYVPMNPMQSKAGAIQPSQPAKVEKHANKKKMTGNNYQNVLRAEEMVRPKSSKMIGSDMGKQTGLNKDYEPQSNWPDGNAFKNPYSAAEN